MRLLSRFAVLGAVLIGACGTWHAQTLPAPISPLPRATGWLRAGASQVDITPPPGLGLAGSGPESRRSTGYRTRLYTQAIVLEDASGERIALVTADLAHISTSLHRLTAERLVHSTGIGADRLIMSSTHTHSGPAHFYAERQYNTSVSRIGGYDPRFVDFLVQRFVQAVEQAASTMEPAKIAAGDIAVVGATYNRSLAPFCRNPEHRDTPSCTDTLPGHAVDSLYYMLRVDRLDRSSGQTSPLGSYSVFAVHGTGIPSLNTLYDGDVPLRVVRHLARKVDSVTGFPAVHALANGTEGDVAPAVEPRDPSCRPPSPGIRNAVQFPKGPLQVDFLEPGAALVRRCLDDALATIDRIANRIADSAAALYLRLGDRLTTEIPIRRVFQTAWLPGVNGLCNSPVLGSGAAGGAEGAETRVRGWDRVYLPYWPSWRVAIGEGGGAAAPDPGSCHSPKRGLIEPLQSKLVVGEHGFPEVAQLSLVRIGSTVLAAAPGEITTTAGTRMRSRIRTSLTRATRWTPGAIIVVSMANGFMQYVPTREEYQLQHYEGASALYGPGTAQFLTDRFGEMSLRLPAPSSPSPPAVVPSITAYPGPPASRLPAAVTVGTIGRQPISLACRNGRLLARWNDQPPSALLATGTPLGAFVEDGTPVDRAVAVDGDGWMEIEVTGGTGDGLRRWTASWKPAGTGRYVFVRLDPNGVILSRSEVRQCPNP